MREGSAGSGGATRAGPGRTSGHDSPGNHYAMSDHHQTIAVAGMNGTVWLASVGSFLGAFFGWLPTILAVISSLLAIVLFSLQIYGDRTFQSWRKRRRR